MFLKVSSLVLSLFILTQSINVHFKDMVHLGALLEHFELHESEYGDSFFSFISKHYGNKISQHKDHQEKKGGEHQKLPFKHKVCADGVQFFLIAPVAVKCIASSDCTHQQPSFYYNNYSFLENSDIFEPPKVS